MKPVRPLASRTGTRTVRTAADLGLRFRGSNLVAHEVVVDAQIALTPGDRAAANGWAALDR